MLVFSDPASAAIRMTQRSLYMNSVEPSATTWYKVSFNYMSATPVGSVDMQFCIDPIPHHECVKPAGLDVSQAVLSEQTGETGFVIGQQTENRIVLTRTATTPVISHSSYKFDNIVNPNYVGAAFSIRLKTHTSTDATGPEIDFGSVRGQIPDGIIIETQVPPMLIFCVAQQVEYNCENSNKTYYTDMGIMDPNSTLFAQSEMAIGTNASQGFSITVNGIPPSAGTHSIGGLSEPTASLAGTNQFGLNLVDNTYPDIGAEPEWDWDNAMPAPDYSLPDQFKFQSGDVVASAPNVSLMRKFTVSYILNSSEDVHPGIYTTTISYIASGRF